MLVLKTAGGRTTGRHKDLEIFSSSTCHKHLDVILGFGRRVLPNDFLLVTEPSAILSPAWHFPTYWELMRDVLPPERRFDSCTFLDTAQTWKQSTPHCTCGAFQRARGRHHIVNYSFIFPLAAFAIRQGFACIITDFDMDEALLRFVYYRFFLWIMLPDFA